MAASARQLLISLSLTVAFISQASGVCVDQERSAVNPSDLAAPGPYPVGRTTISGFTGEDRDWPLEVWYPGARGTAAPSYSYDAREFLPPRHQGKIPDGLVDLPCNCSSDIPADTEDGPYPLLVFIHGTGGFRYNSLANCVHLASRGFVVVSADHPGINLLDFFDGGAGRAVDQAGDVRVLLGALREEPISNPALAFLDTLIDRSRVGIFGQSAGGIATVELQDEASVLIPLSAGFPLILGDSKMVIGADLDSIVPYAFQLEQYQTSTPTKRLVGLGNSGHLSTAPDVCFLGRDFGGLPQIGMDYGIPETALFDIQGCESNFQPAEALWPVLNFALAGAFEETLYCEAGHAAQLANIANIYPDVVFQYEQVLLGPPEIQVVSAARDAMINERKPHVNYGERRKLRLGQQKRALIGFDLDFPEGTRILGASLVLTVASPLSFHAGNRRSGRYAPPVVVRVHPVAGVEWSEGSGNKNSSSASGSGVTWACANDEDISNREQDCEVSWEGGEPFLATTLDEAKVRCGRTEVALDVSLAVLGGEGDFLIDLNDEAFVPVTFASRERFAKAPRLEVLLQPVLE